MKTDDRTPAIATNVDALNHLLQEAATRTNEARELLQRGERNGAIGALVGLDDTLNDARALYRAAIALHRQK